MLCILACDHSTGYAGSPHPGAIANLYSKFTKPQKVSISGLPNGFGGTLLSTEEPFVSRDGRYLFFNSGQQENNKDLHYAERLGDQWVYRGEIGPDINNSKDVQGNPSMDGDYNFFYVDSGTVQMIQRATFLPDKGELQSVRELEGVPKREVRVFAQELKGNMGVEVSADGGTLFFSRARWGLRGLSIGSIAGSDILFVQRKDGKYIDDRAEANRVMKHINTSDLEYAASISTDTLELFFTRLARADLESGHIRSRIMRSTRRASSEPFSKPQEIVAVGSSDFVEGPAISGDGRTLYYHKHVGQKFRLFKVTRDSKTN